MPTSPRQEAMALVRKHRGIDILARSVLFHMLESTRDSLMLFWKSEVELADIFEVSTRSMKRVFDRLRRAELLFPTAWPTALAGKRRTRVKSYALQVTEDRLLRLESPASYLRQKRSIRAPMVPQSHQTNSATVANKWGHGGKINSATVAHDSRETLRDKTETEERDRVPPSPPVVPSEDPKEALRHALEGRIVDRRGLSPASLSEWWGMLVDEKRWHIPRRAWAIRAALAWIFDQPGRFTFSRDADRLQSDWVTFERGVVLNRAKPRPVVGAA